MKYYLAIQLILLTIINLNYSKVSYLKSSVSISALNILNINRINGYVSVVIGKVDIREETEYRYNK